MTSQTAKPALLDRLTVLLRDRGQRHDLVAAVFARLANRRGGLRLNAPPYTAFDPEIGRVSGFAPGTKENNAVFNHLHDNSNQLQCFLQRD